jgi:hypothetical protein
MIAGVSLCQPDQALAIIFPGLEEAFDYSTRSALILLTGFQTPTGLRAAGVDSVAQFLRAQQAWGACQDFCVSRSMDGQAR